MAELTPMMQQYFRLKEQHEDCLLFFRLGDFYEMFFEDARKASAELDLVLTSRDRNKPEAERTPMCGVPYHSAEAYIARLIAKGYKVAICEQTEDPAKAKGLVEREVVRVITPGTLIEASMLEEGRSNYLAALHVSEAGIGFCFSDVSTGEFFLSAYPRADFVPQILSELARYSPRELLLSPGAAVPAVLDALRDKPDCRFELLPETRFDTAAAARFATPLATLPVALSPALPALGALLSYLQHTQKCELSQLTTLRYHTVGDFMELDPNARRNLELCESLRGKEKRGSLLWVLDKTKTPMGGRLLRFWLERPLLSQGEIQRRQDAVAALLADLQTRDALTLALRELGDLERLISRIAFGTASGRDVVALYQGLTRLPALRALLAGQNAPLLRELEVLLDEQPALCDLISRGMAEDPPFSLREGSLIRAGYHEQVDYLRDILKNSRDVVAGIELREREKTGIKGLKIGYNRVFGYYLEVSKSYFDQVPAHYVRKQTLSNCERYISQELKDMEHTILSAEDRLHALEYQLFTELREQVGEKVSAIQHTAAAVAQLDVLLSFATVAQQQNYCRPLVDESARLMIREGRHPVVERVLKDTLFTPNDTDMDCDASRACIITGPNMAGKSTYMRQVALIVLLAQVGSFVPAKSAHIGIVDRIFTRIGASDDLAGGASTFMVEMREVAELLAAATPKSLLILDEIGRGTSTYDGMAIARAVLEHCASLETLGAKTLFATHYHELTSLADELSGVRNYHIAAKKREGDIIFLRKILPGCADQSFGVEVAKLAGVPACVVERGHALLLALEAEASARHGTAPRVQPLKAAPETPAEVAVLARLRDLSIDSLSPLEALNALHALKQLL